MPFAQLVLGSPGSGKSTYCNGSTSLFPPASEVVLTGRSAPVHVSHWKKMLRSKPRPRERSHELPLRNRRPRPYQIGGYNGRR